MTYVERLKKQTSFSLKPEQDERGYHSSFWYREDCPEEDNDQLFFTVTGREDEEVDLSNYLKSDHRCI